MFLGECDDGVGAAAWGPGPGGWSGGRPRSSPPYRMAHPIKPHPNMWWVLVLRRALQPTLQ